MRNLDTLDIRKSKVVINQIDTRLVKFRKHPSAITQEIFDFRVNEKSLRDLIYMSNGFAPDLSTGLGVGYVMKEQRRYINRLLRKVAPDLRSGRVALLVCPIDGDLECGAIGCRIRFDKEAGTVTWYDFAWDGNMVIYDDEPHEKVKGLERFTFDEHEYWWLMYQILQDLSVKGEVDP